MKTPFTLRMPQPLLDVLDGYNRSAIVTQALNEMAQRGVLQTVSSALSRRLADHQGTATDAINTGVSMDVELRAWLKNTAAVTGLSEAQLVIYALEDLFAAAAHV